MITDATLAIFHHWLAFGLVGLIMAEWAVLRGALTPESVRVLPRIDGLYGLVAILLLVVGGLRVTYGAKGYAFYMGNPIFWLKVALFTAAGLVSILPTIRYVRWSRELAASGGLPDASVWLKVRKLTVVELHLLAGVMICAALMARGIGHRGA
jgi:putative membrane protein